MCSSPLGGDVSSEASAGGFLQLHDGTLRRACEAAAEHAAAWAFFKGELGIL